MYTFIYPHTAVPTLNLPASFYTPLATSIVTPRSQSPPAASFQAYRLQLFQTFLAQLSSGINLVLLTSKKTRESVRCHLSESSHSVLYLIRMNGEVLMIDIGSADITNYHLKYQVAWNLEKEEYMVVTEDGQDYVFLFNNEEQNLWFQTNLRLMKSRAGMLTLDDNEEFGKALSFFRKYAKRYGSVEGISITDFNLIILILNYFNANKTLHILLLLFNNRQVDVLTLSQFSTYLRFYYCKTSLYPIFQKYCKRAPVFNPQRPSLQLLQPAMTISEFKYFLASEQQQSQEDCKVLMRSMGEGPISYYQFCRYIFSKDNYAYRQKISAKETQYPLNYYYCLSSHNTYLVGNQFTSKAKAKRYVQDLERGYRCIELDVHDSSLGPIINHRLTLTTSLLFQDAIKAISKFSNSTIHTPIILSLETNCTPQGRYEMASILIKYFGEKILVVDKSWKAYPKLSSLLNRIIIKGHISIQEMMLYPHPIVKQELLRSITGLYKASVKEQLNTCLTYVSMTYGELKAKARFEMLTLLTMTSRGWMRVYPNASLFSENYNPILCMEAGVQMLAINSQYNDIWKLILQVYFEENSQVCPGYSLKPLTLIEGKRVPSTPLKVIVQVVSTNNIRFTGSSFNYHVKMALFGSQEDDTFGNNFQSFIDVTERTTGEEGVFMNSVPIVYTIRQPCFAFVVFQVTNYGRAAVAVKSLRAGYHTVNILDADLQPIPHSSLLLRISFCY